MEVKMNVFTSGGRLEVSPFAIGFRTEWRTDYARLYKVSWEPESHPQPKRPVLMAIWYPVQETKNPQWYRLPGKYAALPAASLMLSLNMMLKPAPL